MLTLSAVIALTFLLIQRKRLSALLLVVGLAGGVALGEGLKALFERARPPVEYQAVDTLNASFPSGPRPALDRLLPDPGGHADPGLPRRHLKAFVLVAAILIALLIGLTRVYLGAHWASDVIAGWCAGAAWAMVLWLAAYAVERRQQAAHAALQDEPDA